MPGQYFCSSIHVESRCFLHISTAYESLFIAHFFQKSIHLFPISATFRRSMFGRLNFSMIYRGRAYFCILAYEIIPKIGFQVNILVLKIVIVTIFFYFLQNFSEFINNWSIRAQPLSKIENSREETRKRFASYSLW